MEILASISAQVLFRRQTCLCRINTFLSSLCAPAILGGLFKAKTKLRFFTAHQFTFSLYLYTLYTFLVIFSLKHFAIAFCETTNLLYIRKVRATEHSLFMRTIKSVVALSWSIQVGTTRRHCSK